MKKTDFDPSRYPHTFSCEVYIHETDAFGHANNTSYFAYMQNARFDLFKKMDLFDPSDIFTLGHILGHVECSYREIARYNDRLTIYTRVIGISSSSYTLEHVFVREKDRAVVADGKAVLVAFDHPKNTTRLLTTQEKEKLEQYV